MDDNATHVSLLARRLTVELEEFSRAFAITHKLNATDMRAIVMIMDAERHGHPMNASQLSEQLGVANASVTALLDRLEKANHIERAPHPSDRRSLIIKPSKHAMKVARKYFMQLHTAMVGNMQGYTKEELAISAKVLQTMIDTVSAQRESV